MKWFKDTNVAEARAEDAQPEAPATTDEVTEEETPEATPEETPETTPEESPAEAPEEAPAEDNPEGEEEAPAGDDSEETEAEEEKPEEEVDEQPATVTADFVADESVIGFANDDEIFDAELADDYDIPLGYGQIANANNGAAPQVFTPSRSFQAMEMIYGNVRLGTAFNWSWLKKQFQKLEAAELESQTCEIIEMVTFGLLRRISELSQAIDSATLRINSLDEEHWNDTEDVLLKLRKVRGEHVPEDDNDIAVIDDERTAQAV